MLFGDVFLPRLLLLLLQLGVTMTFALVRPKDATDGWLDDDQTTPIPAGDGAHTTTA